MRSKLTTILPLLGALLLSGLFLLQMQPAFAESKSTDDLILKNLGKAAQAPFNADPSGADPKKTPGQIIGTLVKAVLAFTGTVAFLIFLYGGFMWMTARGNDEQVKKAKQYLTNGIVGTIVIILAYSVTYYITDILFKATQS